MQRTTLMVRIHEPGAPLLPEEVPLKVPGPGQVRVEVHASGVCAADLRTAAGRRGVAVTPGHEIAGVIDAIGADVDGWTTGDRVAVGWFGGSCGHCDACRAGDVVHCPERQVPGVSYPGGWAEHITVPAETLAGIPDGLDLISAAPMGCAGVTAFNAVHAAGALPGDCIAVLGLGGVGHLAVQFAAHMGYSVVAIARGAEREDAARSLGARHYIDSTAIAPGAALEALGGVTAIVSTVPATAPVAELLGGLRPHGRLVLVGVGGGTLDLPMASLVMNAQTVCGHLTGSPLDTERAMQFAVDHGVRPRIERLPLARADEALDRLRTGTVRFRTVLCTQAEVRRADHRE